MPVASTQNLVIPDETSSTTIRTKSQMPLHRPAKVKYSSHRPMFAQKTCAGPAEYNRAICNHDSTVVLGAIVDPYMPIHIATGILPSTTLKLPQWVIDQTLKKLRVLLRGGPVLSRGDLVGVETTDAWRPPMNKTVAEAEVAPLTTHGEWSWLQPVVSDYAEGGADDEYLPSFVPYNLKQAPADYPLQPGPHTILEGFYKFGLQDMKDKGSLELGKPPAQ